MKFKEYIEGTDFDKIWEHLIKWYPDQEKSKECYEKVWKELQTLTLEADYNSKDMRIGVYYVPKDDKWNDDEYYGVHGISNETEHGWALEYTKWEKWLGYEVDWETYNKYEKEFVIAHCLFELTWSGFTQEKIQKNLEELQTNTKEKENEKSI